MERPGWWWRGTGLWGNLKGIYNRTDKARWVRFLSVSIMFLTMLLAIYLSIRRYKDKASIYLRPSFSIINLQRDLLCNIMWWCLYPKPSQVASNPAKRCLTQFQLVTWPKIDHSFLDCFLPGFLLYGHCVVVSIFLSLSLLNWLRNIWVLQL